MSNNTIVFTTHDVHQSSDPKPVLKTLFGPVNFQFYLELYENKFKNLIPTSKFKFHFEDCEYKKYFLLSTIIISYIFSMEYCFIESGVKQHNHIFLIICEQVSQSLHTNSNSLLIKRAP